MSKFDRAIKEIMQNIFLQSSNTWLGMDLREATLEELNPKISRALDREADFLKKVSHPDLGTFILHLEFQSKDDRKMHYRMAEYKALLQRRFELPVKQYVIYLGSRRSKMITTFPEAFQIIGYQLLELNRFNTEQILSSNLPDEIILAILTDYPTSDAKAIVGKIIERLKLLELSPESLQRVIYRLLTLSQLRTLDKTIKQQVQDMPISIDITKSEIYQEGKQSGLAEGLEKGLEEGLEQGKQSGLAEGKKQAIEGFLRTGKLSEQDIADALGVTREYVLAIKKEM